MKKKKKTKNKTNKQKTNNIKKKLKQQFFKPLSTFATDRMQD